MTWRAALLLTFLTTCAAEPATNDDLRQAMRISAPPALYGGLDWLSDRQLVVAARPPHLAPVALRLLDQDGSSSPVDLASPDDCLYVQYSRPTKLGSAAVATIRECRRVSDDRLSYQIVAVDLRDRRIRSELTEPTFQWLTEYALTPNERVAFVTLGRSICSTIARITRAGTIQLLDVIVGEGDATWNLMNGDSPSGDCIPYGRAWSPALSPDGTTLAFLASPDSIGLDGESRIDTPANLMMLDIETNTTTTLLRGIYNGSELSWAPDASTLAFTGALADVEGIWLFDVSAGDVRRVFPSDVMGLAWSLDGRRLAITRETRLATNDRRSELLVIAL